MARCPWALCLDDQSTQERASRPRIHQNQSDKLGKNRSRASYLGTMAFGELLTRTPIEIVFPVRDRSHARNSTESSITVIAAEPQCVGRCGPKSRLTTLSLSTCSIARVRSLPDAQECLHRNLPVNTAVTCLYRGEPSLRRARSKA